jgi:hypothetical protein
MAARSALELISASLKRLNVISGIETPSADLATDALERLNDLLETWATESLSIYALMTIGRGIIVPPTVADWYTVGPGGDIDVAVRPPWIESASYILPNATPAPFEYKLAPLSRAEWINLPNKLQTSTQPTHYYWYPVWPLGHLFLWPMLEGGSFQLWLYVPVPLDRVPSLTTLIDLPQGYFRALRDNLAIELAPELGVQIHGGLMASATEAKAQLQRVNYRPTILGMPAGLGDCGGVAYDWRTDT